MRIVYALFLILLLSYQYCHAQCCSFTAQQQVEPATSAATFGVSLGDFDGDGDLDAVAVSAYYGIDVYFNNGSGTFTLNAQYAVGGNSDFYGAHVTDIDGDNDKDVIVAPFYTSSSATILRNNGSGVFTVASVSTNVATYNFAIGDVDGDNDVDAFMPSGGGGNGKILKNNGTGTYSVFQTVAGARGHDAALGDIDGDGDIDAFVSENSSYGNSIFLNNGSGTFTQSGTNFGTAGGEVALGDLDTDGDLDAWVGTSGNTSELWINNGSGTFTAGPVVATHPTWGYCKGVVLADNDNDGDLDVFLCFYSHVPQVWTNNGNLSFSLCYQATAGSSSHGLAVGDINGDGKKDMYTSYFSNDDGDYVFLQGNSNAATISYAGSPYSTSLTTPQSVTQTGATGGTYSAIPTGLTINSSTGAITPNTSTPGTYTVSYNVSGCVATTDVEVVAAGAPSCSASGNVMVFANYDGGVLNINVDVNIPNLKIGVCTYEPVVVNLTGPYAANVTQVIRAGYPNTNNNHCGGITSSAINGPVPANYSIVNIPPVTLNNPNGYNFGIICAYNCNTTTPSGGCNTIDQVIDYFSTQFGGSLYSVTAQYCCWQNSSSYNVSSLSNSCCASSNPSATIAYSGSPYCKSLTAPQAVSFTGSTGGTYSASPSGLSINSASGEITPSSSSIGTYTVTYTIPGCPAFTTTTTVSITVGPSATISYPANTFCSNAALQNVTQTGTTGGTYSSTPAGLDINTTTGAILPSASTAGTYTVSYTIPSSGSCSAYVASDTVEITSAVTFSFSAGICSGNSYTFGSQTLDSAGIYSETFTAHSGCDSIVTLTLSVTSLPAPQLTVSDTVICSGDTAELCAPQGFTSYLWNTGESGLCILATLAGNYYVTVYDANNCSVQSVARPIAAYPAPSVSISVNGDTLKAFNATAYQWYLNGNAINGAIDSFFVAQNSGNYHVMITDANGCRAVSSTVAVTVIGVDYFQEPVSLIVYPNPTTDGKLTVEIPEEWAGTELILYNCAGQIIYQSSIKNSSAVIDLKAGKGIYFLHLRSADGVRIQRVIHL